MHDYGVPYLGLRLEKGVYHISPAGSLLTGVESAPIAPKVPVVNQATPTRTYRTSHHARVVAVSKRPENIPLKSWTDVKEQRVWVNISPGPSKLRGWTRSQ